MKAGKPLPGFDWPQGCEVTSGSAHLKSSLPLESTLWLELVPIKQVWFSNHLVSVRPESKPREKVWVFQSQRKAESMEICEVNMCKGSDTGRGSEREGGGCIASCMLRDIAKLPACIHIHGLSFCPPAFPPFTSQGGSWLPTLLLQSCSQPVYENAISLIYSQPHLTGYVSV